MWKAWQETQHPQGHHRRKGRRSPALLAASSLAALPPWALLAWHVHQPAASTDNQLLFKE